MKPEFMRLRRALATSVATLLVAVGIVAVSPALSASAHHNTISVTASCVNYVWSVNWTIVNSERDKTEQVTSSSDQAIIAIGTVIGKSGTYAKSESVSGPTTKTLTVSAAWSNGVKNTNSATIKPRDFKGTCAPASPPVSNPPVSNPPVSNPPVSNPPVTAPPATDTPVIDVTESTCSLQGKRGGTVSFALGRAAKVYTLELSGTGQKVQQAGGPGHFINVGPGSYKIKVMIAGNPPLTSVDVVVPTCELDTPVIDVTDSACSPRGKHGGSISFKLNRATKTYIVALDGTTQTVKHAGGIGNFTGLAPGTYKVKVVIAGKPPAATAIATATVPACEPSTPSKPESTPPIGHGPEAPGPSSPGSGAPNPGGEGSGTPGPDNHGPDSACPKQQQGDTLSVTTATRCTLDTLAPPEIALMAARCDSVAPAVGALSARVIELDATKSYYVRIVDSRGATVVGGSDQLLTGVTAATVHFPQVTSLGTYTAQLLIDPNKQLAATSPNSVELQACLPTLAVTGASALIPLGGFAALLLTLGGAVVVGRLRRRMAL